jgi:hypothetical protein
LDLYISARTVLKPTPAFTKYAQAISWETEVWIADNPSHLIHFNGARFLGLLGSRSP